MSMTHSQLNLKIGNSTVDFDPNEIKKGGRWERRPDLNNIGLESRFKSRRAQLRRIRTSIPSISSGSPKFRPISPRNRVKNQNQFNVNLLASSSSSNSRSRTTRQLRQHGVSRHMGRAAFRPALQRPDCSKVNCPVLSPTCAQVASAHMTGSCCSKCMACSCTPGPQMIDCKKGGYSQGMVPLNQGFSPFSTMVCQCYDDGNIMCITDTSNKGTTTQGPLVGHGSSGIGPRGHSSYDAYQNMYPDYYATGNQTGNHPPRTSYANYHYPDYYDYNYYDHYSNQVSLMLLLVNVMLTKCF